MSNPSDEIGGQGGFGIESRRLYDTLQIRQKYADWIRSRITALEWRLHVDFVVRREDPERGRPRQEYLLSVLAAKELILSEILSAGRDDRRAFLATISLDALIAISGARHTRRQSPEAEYRDLLAARLPSLINGAVVLGCEADDGRGGRIDILASIGGCKIPIEVKLRARPRDAFQAREYVESLGAPYGYLAAQTPFSIPESLVSTIRPLVVPHPAEGGRA